MRISLPMQIVVIGLYADMKEDPTRDGGIRWMSWVLGTNKNVQRTDDPVVGVNFVFETNSVYVF